MIMQRAMLAALFFVLLGIGISAFAVPGRADPPAAGAGIAAKYPGDRGIERDPHVLFAEDFATGSLNEVIKRWTDGSSDKAILALRDDAPAGSSSKRSLQVTATFGKNTGGFLYKRLPRAVDQAFLRFYVKFAPDADYIHHFMHIGGYNPPTPYAQGGAGQRPRGDERITVGIEPTGNHGRDPAPGEWNFYAYWHEMKISADGKYWGNAISPKEPLLVPRDRWQCVEVMLKLNSAPEKADGELALWLDGKPAMSIRKGTPRADWTGLGFHVLEEGGAPFEGFRWRTSPDLKINFLWLLHYVTENSARANNVANPHPINRVWFDNIVVSTEYIGPIQK